MPLGLRRIVGAIATPRKARFGDFKTLLTFTSKPHKIHTRPGAEGRPKPGYIELVVAAAREWDLPETYIHFLESFASARPVGPDARKIGEFR